MKSIRVKMEKKHAFHKTNDPLIYDECNSIKRLQKGYRLEISV